MKEVVIVKKEFFELTKIEQRRVLISLIYYSIKKIINTFKNK